MRFAGYGAWCCYADFRNVYEEKIMPKASVKVMRSYDYCHFEVALSSDDDLTLEQINEMRKDAALLADEAVRQYKIAKKKENKRESLEWEIQRTLERVARIEAKPRSEWTIEEAALMRANADGEFWKDFDQDSYGYDDPEREQHFSMLHQFRDVTLKSA
jgi:hypothetical protein